MTIFCRLCVSAFLSLAVLSQKFYTLVWCVHVVVSRCTGFGRFVLAALFNFLLFAPTLILSISQLGYIDVLQNTYHPAQARILFYSYHIINQSHPNKFADMSDGGGDWIKLEVCIKRNNHHNTHWVIPSLELPWRCVC